MSASPGLQAQSRAAARVGLDRHPNADTPPVRNLARLDMNLVLALDALLQHGNVTRAAEQLGLTQPALSASLARLRRHFDDELLVRTGNTYRLSPLATLLKERTRVALASFDRVFHAEPEFDPGTSRREFSLIVTDYAVAVLGPALTRIVAREAPHTRLRLDANTPAVVARIQQALLTSDLMIMPHGDVLDLHHRDLHRDEWVCVVSADHPVVGRGLTVDDLRTMPWVAAFQTSGASTPAVRQMRILGIEPHFQVVTESFLAVPGLVAGSDRVALLQRRLVDLVGPRAGIVALPCPFEVSPLTDTMWWHPARDADPEHRWLRDAVLRASRPPMTRS